MVQGESPMTRQPDGRHLPRTYVLRRRHAGRSAPLTGSHASAAIDDIDHTVEQTPVALIDPIESGTPVAELPNDAPPAEPALATEPDTRSHESLQMAAPGPTIISVASPHAAVEMGSPEADARTIELPVAPPEPPIRPVVRPPDGDRAHDTERRVELPLDRLSDRGRKTPANGRSAPHSAPRPTPEIAHTRGRPTWLLVVLVVALVALVSSAIGAAIGAWVTAEHTSTSSTR
jgi:hypothetical protein